MNFLSDLGGRKNLVSQQIHHTLNGGRIYREFVEDVHKVIVEKAACSYQ